MHLGWRDEYLGFSLNEIFQEQQLSKLIGKSEYKYWAISRERTNVHPPGWTRAVLTKPGGGGWDRYTVAKPNSAEVLPGCRVTLVLLSCTFCIHFRYAATTAGPSQGEDGQARCNTGCRSEQACEWWKVKRAKEQARHRKQASVTKQHKGG